VYFIFKNITYTRTHTQIHECTLKILFIMLQGHPFPRPSVCVNATNALYGPNDQCARLFSSYALTNISDESEALLIPGCAIRFRNFLTACRELLVGVNISEVSVIISWYT